MSTRDSISNAYDSVPAIIASGSTTSGAVSLGGLRLFGFITPAALTGTSFTVLASIDGVTFSPLYDANGVQVSISAAVNRFIALDPTLYANIPYMQIVSNATEAAARSITLVLRGV